MSALDSVADTLRRKSQELAGQGGIKDKLAAELADDADFISKLKPELIKRRAKGEAPTDREPTQGSPPAPSGPQLGKRQKAPKPAKTGGPNPYVVVGAALVLGVALAKWLDWRGHAHPRW
jgi:hypothetical protein